MKDLTVEHGQQALGDLAAVRTHVGRQRAGYGLAGRILDGQHHFECGTSTSHSTCRSDIDWHAGTITLRHTKGRRVDILPLPVATGEAIARDVELERPKTSNRAIFVRNVAPRDAPIGADLIRITIRQTYARAGLPYTRSHLLRHTMATRLLASGSSLKEVADVLRHRSLNTTMIYAKLDSRSLAAVALPWPGSAS